MWRFLQARKAGFSMVTVLGFLTLSTVVVVGTYTSLQSWQTTRSENQYYNTGDQAALAGLNHAAAWMSERPMNAAALFQTFYDKKMRQPVRFPLDSMGKSASQSYKVFLVGMETSTDPIIPTRVKIQAIGTGKNGAEVTMDAVYAVSGIWLQPVQSWNQDGAPKLASWVGNAPDALQQSTVGESGDSYFGGLSQISGGYKSMFKGNLLLGKSSGPVTINGTVIVKGSMYSVEDVSVAPGGSTGEVIQGESVNGIVFEGPAVFEKSLNTGTNNTITFKGDLYVGGNFSVGDGNTVVVEGNLTVAGQLSASRSTGQSLIVKGDMSANSIGANKYSVNPGKTCIGEANFSGCTQATKLENIKAKFKGKDNSIAIGFGFKADSIDRKKLTWKRIMELATAAEPSWTWADPTGRVFSTKDANKIATMTSFVRTYGYNGFLIVDLDASPNFPDGNFGSGAMQDPLEGKLFFARSRGDLSFKHMQGPCFPSSTANARIVVWTRNAVNINSWALCPNPQHPQKHGTFYGLFLHEGELFSTPTDGYQSGPLSARSDDYFGAFYVNGTRTRWFTNGVESGTMRFSFDEGIINDIIPVGMTDAMGQVFKGSIGSGEGYFRTSGSVLNISQMSLDKREVSILRDPKFMGSASDNRATGSRPYLQLSRERIAFDNGAAELSDWNTAVSASSVRAVWSYLGNDFTLASDSIINPWSRTVKTYQGALSATCRGRWISRDGNGDYNPVLSNRKDTVIEMDYLLACTSSGVEDTTKRRLALVIGRPGSKSDYKEAEPVDCSTRKPSISGRTYGRNEEFVKDGFVWRCVQQSCSAEQLTSPGYFDKITKCKTGTNAVLLCSDADFAGLVKETKSYSAGRMYRTEANDVCFASVAHNLDLGMGWVGACPKYWTSARMKCVQP